VGILLWLLGLSVSSQEGFMQAATIMNSFFVKFIFWGILTALAYHICGGIRHLLMDFGYLEENLAVGTRSAQVAMGLTLVLSVLAGVLVW
ncbi:succinate dehydrogenase, cytochrome b556 subunit, partial [Yersinia pestis]